MDLNGYNAEDVEPSKSFEPLEPGWYSAMITDSEERDTRAGNGSYLSLTFEVIEGPAKGRKLWANLNLNNPNEKAVEIAKRDLSAICHAVGVMRPKDSADLHHKPLAIHVKIDAKDSSRNVIKGYRETGAKASAPKAAEKPAKAAPPWQRKAG